MTSMAAIAFVSYHIVHLKQQNHSEVGTDKPELKIKMQTVFKCFMHEKQTGTRCPKARCNSKI